MLDGVLVDNQLINIPLLTLFKWDGGFPISMEIWERVKPIRAAVLGTIEDLAPKTNNYVFTKVLKDDEDGATHSQALHNDGAEERPMAEQAGHPVRRLCEPCRGSGIGGQSLRDAEGHGSCHQGPQTGEKQEDGAPVADQQDHPADGWGPPPAQAA